MSAGASLFEFDLMDHMPHADAPVSAPSTEAVASKSTPVAAAQFNYGQISLPLNYNNLLQVFLAASREGSVFPYFVRQTLIVPAGTIGEIVTTIPAGDVASVVYLLKVSSKTYSSEMLVTLQADSYPDLFVDAPLVHEIEVLGSFLPPSKTRGVYTFVNNDSIDITVVTDVQIAVMTSAFVRDVYDPLIRGQYRALEALGEAFRLYKGGAAS